MKTEEGKFFIELSLISFVPSFVFVAFSASSLAVGLVLASITIWGMNATSGGAFRFLYSHFLAYVCVVVLLFSTGAYHYALTGNEKGIASTVALLFILPAAASLAKSLSCLRIDQIGKVLYRFSLLLILIGWVGLFYTPSALNYDPSTKAVFPFSEQSHFALVLGFFSCVYTSIGSRRRSFFLLLNMATLGAAYPNLTLIVFSTLIIVVLSLRDNKLLIAALVPALLIVAFTAVMSNPYFSSRLNIQNTSNLTTIVFLQGWELAFLNADSGNGLGLGFQMLGGPHTEIGPRTAQVMAIASGGRALNLEDGGFLAAKVIAEFGAAGFVAICLYAFALPMWLIRGARHRGTFHNNSERKILLYASLFALSTEIFLRGYGYFSPSLFFVLSVAIASRRGLTFSSARNSV